MAVITGQISLIDYGDALTLTGFITANSPRIQQYSPADEKFTPDWTKTPLILTASLFKMGDSNDIIRDPEVQSINWYDASNAGTPLKTGGPYSVNNETLTIKDNILSDKPAIDFICEVVYRDTDSMMDIPHKMSISFSRVSDGSSVASASAWLPNGNIFKNDRIPTLIAECDLWRSGKMDNTNVSFQWYNQDPTVTEDQGGGAGWRKLTDSSNSGETGYTTRQLTVPSSAVPSFEVYKCVITDTDSSSPTYNQTYQDTVTFLDQSDPVQVSITSTGGDVFKNGVGSTTLSAQVYQGGQEIDKEGEKYQYKWYKYNKEGVLDPDFGGSKTYKEGKSLKVTSDDVDVKATFLCGIDGAVAQFTIYDITDTVVSPTEPANPVEGMIWLKNSGEPPYRFYIYKDGGWQTTDFDSLESLDPDSYNRVKDAYNAITDLDMDNKITRYERSVIRGELANILGVYLSDTDNMPTIDTVDASGAGDLYSIRKQARDVGVPTNDAKYVQIGAAYTDLKDYLTSLPIKPWDVGSLGVIEVDSDEWDSAWKNYYLAYNFLSITVTNRQKEYTDIVGDGAKKDAIAAVSNADQYQEALIKNPMTITAPIASLGLPIFEGRHVDSWSLNPDAKDNWALNGNRIQPITNPIVSSVGSLTIYGQFYGDGTNNDQFTWDRDGKAVKIKRWADISLDGDFQWQLGEDYTGAKQVLIPNFIDQIPAAMTAQAVKHDGTFLTTIDSDMATADQVILGEDRVLYISVADIESGWGEDYAPEPKEIAAYFNGWRMCNGTFGTPYNGVGNKVWYPIGDKDLSRSTIVSGGNVFNPVPEDRAPTLEEQTINKYQLVYRNSDAVRQTVDFDGIMSLLQGDNQVSFGYPLNTPFILSGVIKYATNVATVTDNLKYWIPAVQERLSKAEQVITEDSITNIVTNSVQYRTALASKADTEALGDYATTGDLTDLSGDINGRIANAIDAIDFEPYATKSELKQTATDITAKFQATGGMNLIKNSIGFAGLSFWTGFTDTPVETLSTNELDMLGFGSGFLFNPDGNNKGIIQEVGVTPGQPYTLSWYLNKRTSGPDSSYRFWIQIEEDDVVVKQIKDNSATTTNGYESSYMTYIPQSDSIKVKFIGYGNVDATLTGIMLNISDIPLSWSLATGEVYNTNIRLDINGIRVSQLDENRREIGFTQITPEEFAGYHDSDGNGSFEKIFFLNGDETVTKKLRAEEEITTKFIKMINVDSPTRKGLAFIPNVDIVDVD
ncbi:tail protein [Bacillus phage vB_BsuM-Goe3]|uniref:Putative tail fiber n=1 Tax=Bacillus phage vB_BsuM-Goe3 TaxID=1933063 RepID=A0A217ER39_BPGO3|nr:tail protein [Bacillus phage vB_BsuM-Goe3]APZ82548.1 putative tail fiber [Bacillus phage vB_BsuM-Goe3]